MGRFVLFLAILSLYSLSASGTAPAYHKTYLNLSRLSDIVATYYGTEVGRHVAQALVHELHEDAENPYGPPFQALEENMALLAVLMNL